MATDSQVPTWDVPGATPQIPEGPNYQGGPLIGGTNGASALTGALTSHDFWLGAIAGAAILYLLLRR